MAYTLTLSVTTRLTSSRGHIDPKGQKRAEFRLWEGLNWYVLEGRITPVGPLKLREKGENGQIWVKFMVFGVKSPKIGQKWSKMLKFGRK